jgi:hypothetical protein
MTTLLLLAALAQGEPILDEAPQSVRQALDRARERSDWTAWFSLVEQIDRALANRLVRRDERWVGLGDAIRRETPAEAVEWHRGRHGDVAAAEVRAGNLEAAARRYWTDAAEGALHALGNVAFDEGRTEAALHWWRLCLEHPRGALPRNVLREKLAMASAVPPAHRPDGVHRRSKSVEPLIARREWLAPDAIAVASADVVVFASGSQLTAANGGGILWSYRGKGAAVGVTIAASKVVAVFREEMVCLELATGRVGWTTEEGRLRAAMRSMGLVPAFESEAVACGEGFSAAVDERVAGFDRVTGEPRWVTFVASPPGPSKTRPTLLARDGVLYVQTNLGVVAALDALTGRIGWVARSGAGDVVRGACAPVLFEGRLYVLGQQGAEPAVFEAATGSRVALPIRREINWRQVKQLVGTIGRWLVMAGETTVVVELDSVRAYVLPMAVLAGRAAIDGETLYLPTKNELMAFHGAGSFWNVATTPCSARAVVPMGEQLVVVSKTGVTIAVDGETLRRENEARMAQSPADARVPLSMALSLSERGLWSEAKPYWAEYLRLR